MAELGPAYRPGFVRSWRPLSSAQLVRLGACVELDGVFFAQQSLHSFGADHWTGAALELECPGRFDFIECVRHVRPLLTNIPGNEPTN